MVSGEGKDSGPVRALIDTGAQPNLVSHQLAERLQLRKMQATRKIVGINGEPFHIKYWSKIKVRPWFSSSIAIEQEFLILPREGPLRPMLLSNGLGHCEATEIDGLPLADPEFWREGPADLLLGCKFVVEMFGSIMTRQPSGLFSMKTTFGRVMLGQRQDSLRVKDENAYVVCLDNKQMHEALKRLWVLDEISPPPVRSREEELVERNFVDTYRRDRDGRFIVTIPLREAWREIGTTELTARRRFFALERKLERDPELKEKYVDFMREYESKGHMTPVVGTTSRAKMTYHIPHHCVTKKFRVVFDASCKTTMGVSLNEVQMVGEKLQKDLHEILMRFRRHRIAISADIKMMFRMVKIAKEQWDLQRIYWRESPQERLREYWLTVVTYGMASSAHNAVRALIQCARDAETDFPRASKVIREDFYMDDCTTGADSEIEAIRLFKEIDHILKGAGFELRKWNSNSKALVKDMSKEKRDSVVFREDEGTSILGLKWLLAKDQFTFEVKAPITESMMTKRKIVSCVAQLYDPNGYISPVTILGKILIQDVWRSKADWDDELAKDILERWEELWREITCLEQFRVERWIGTSPGMPIEVHGFSDASEKAYGAVIYVRTEHPNGEIWSTLLQAKTRVAPLKTVTIPRLELAAAELLGRLVENVKETMEWKEIEYTLWTDSAVVLHWINKQPCELKTFVANRVASIQTNTEIDRWRHVGSRENPADLLSRGMRASELVKSELWLHGPQWLRQPRSQWKSEKFVPNVSDGGRDEMKVKVMTVISVDEELSITTRKTGERVPVHEYVSTLEKAINVIGYVFRFTEAIKRKKANGKRKRQGKMRRRSVRQKRKSESRPIQLTSEEKERAIEYLLRKEQRRYFSKEIASIKSNSNLPERSKIESLKPILDSREILRVGGRLGRSDLEYGKKHPAIVPNGSRLAWLIIDSAHRATKHGAVQVMMHHIRERFWITKLRSESRRYLHNCLVCVRYNHRFETQLMADLPRDRVTPGKAFLHSGVDYAGPFVVKMIDQAGEQVTRQKCWISVFVCLKTRAVHIDLVSSLSSIAFIACYERFVARRGRCERIYSDNGTAFVGAAKELQKAKESWHRKESLDFLAAKGTDWRFMTPAAPHQGGIYEAAVKSMKFHLTRVIGAKILTYEQLLTLTAGVEAILNSRPLQAISDDPSDLQALTPGHFLVGEPLVLPLPFVTGEISNSHGARLWKERKTMLKHFWDRWREEYLVTLLERKKWRREKHGLQIGQLCIIKSENFPPSAWALGRIKRLIKGKDGLVRSVEVQTATNQLTRPVQKICILPNGE